ncbi:MAG: DUF3800 domain-containing protein [Syntrophobacteraceae bacterium]
MTWIYYDESGENDAAGNLLSMTMGGCMSSLDKWKEFEIAWKTILANEGLDFFHMTDFEAYRPPFNFQLAGGSRDKKKHERILNSLLDLMVKYIEGFYGFASKYMTSDKSRAHRLYLEDCIISVVSHAVHEGWESYREPLNLVFAKQPHFSQSGIEKYVDLYDYGEGKDRIKKPVSFCDVKNVCALQAADIIAFEMRCIQRNRVERYPFKKLRHGAIANNIRMMTSCINGEVIS